MKKLLLILLLVGQMGILLPARPVPAETGEASSVDLLDAYGPGQFEGLPYRLMRPLREALEEGESFPLVLVLHSAGGRGADNLRQLEYLAGVLAEGELRRRHPAFVLVPQSRFPWVLPEHLDWQDPLGDPQLDETWRRFLARMSPIWAGTRGRSDLPKVLRLLDYLAGVLPVDRTRVYVVGFSMGAFGVWSALQAAPDRFAAAFAAAGGLLPWLDAEPLSNIPVQSFHGLRDAIVPVEIARSTFRRVEIAGGNLRHSEFSNFGHDPGMLLADPSEKGGSIRCTPPACGRISSLWDWLFQQRKRPAGNPGRFPVSAATP